MRAVYMCARMHSPTLQIRGLTHAHIHSYTHKRMTLLSVSAESLPSLKTPKKTCLYFSPQVLILVRIEMSPELTGAHTHAHAHTCAHPNIYSISDFLMLRCLDLKEIIPLLLLTYLSPLQI